MKRGQKRNMSDLNKIEAGLLCKWIKYPNFPLSKDANSLNKENAATKKANFLLDDSFIISDVVKSKQWTIFHCYYVQTNEMFYFRLTRRNDDFDKI
jgi:hypothetical protein